MTDRNVYLGRIGFVYQTKGGFFRGYRFTRGCGFGPFSTFLEAARWVYEGR